VQCNDIGNIFKKLIVENFSNLEKQLSIQVQKAFRTPNRQDVNKERTLKAAREKHQVTYKAHPSKQLLISQQKP
jgi:hypothetical protein